MAHQTEGQCSCTCAHWEGHRDLETGTPHTRPPSCCVAPPVTRQGSRAFKSKAAHVKLVAAVAAVTAVAAPAWAAAPARAAVAAVAAAVVVTVPAVAAAAVVVAVPVALKNEANNKQGGGGVV